MTERKKDILFLAAMLALLLIFFSRILFTHQIIRAPDIISEFYWGVKDIGRVDFWQLFNFKLKATWNLYVNSGFTTEGGDAGTQFLVFHHLIFWLFPPPSNVAWYIIFHLFIGAAGTYSYCRLIGASRAASFLGGLIFALAPENVSLINAGHVMKIATISIAPWAFYFLEKGFIKRRYIFFLTTGLVLAFQFFHIHWQIAFYTCLCIALYALLRTTWIVMEERSERRGALVRLVCLNLTVLVFFLSTVAVSLAPLAHWSQDTNRGGQSGSNQGKGGLAREEAMSWSMPPEEIATFIIPGFFGFSRQEGGENPTNIPAYYWGRTVFTQTSDYMGLLPWLLVPLPLIFRRDKYTWLAVIAVAGGIVFSMGKYTLFYDLLFDYFPGINRFRVPKMMMFMTVLGLALLAARGLDLLLDEGVRRTKAFNRYIFVLMTIPILLIFVLGVETAGKGHWLSEFGRTLIQPTRYQQGPQLIIERWDNLVGETGMAAAVAALYASVLFIYARQRLSAAVLFLLLVALYLFDTGRVDEKFMFLVDVPQELNGGRTPVMDYLLSHGNDQYRVLPMDGSDPMHFATNGIPVMFTSNAVQHRRWQDFLDTFSLTSPMPDMINLKYLVLAKNQYLQAKVQLGDRYLPVFTSPDSSQVVLENRSALPKGWLVPAIALNRKPGEALSILQNPAFDPRKTAVVESPPPVAMPPSDSVAPLPFADVTVRSYGGERIDLEANAPRNAILVLGEKYYDGWKVTVDGRPSKIYPVDHILRGVYLTPGEHRVEFFFDPLPFRVGKWLTLVSLAVYALFLGKEIWKKKP